MGNVHFPIGSVHYHNQSNFTVAQSNKFYGVFLNIAPNALYDLKKNYVVPFCSKSASSPFCNPLIQLSLVLLKIPLLVIVIMVPVSCM